MAQVLLPLPVAHVIDLLRALVVQHGHLRQPVPPVREAEQVVLSVNYRRAPEHRYPCAYDDGWTALKWAMLQPFLCSGEGAQPRVFLSGDSSGGNVAHHVAVRAADTGIRICGNTRQNEWKQSLTKSQSRVPPAHARSAADAPATWSAARAALCLRAAGAIPNVRAALAGGAAHGFVPDGARGAQDADAAASAARILDDAHMAGRGGGSMRREERDRGEGDGVGGDKNK
ncbi:gibberellin receptor GID1-like [Panicum virgatum]|uniref:gibberellin receptor GID1-like n=1 Tax=Panicum virgatum TaxID=38727 RepID=UPI0019D695D2|nr:gibberellin receptor GID1-like [Panicum virgatum]